MAEWFNHSAMTFEPILRRATAAEACADALRAAIVRGDVAAGGLLPPERELAARFGVDRGTLRAGLQRLVAQGLLHQVQGRGTEVRDFLEVGGLDLLLPVVRAAGAQAAVVDHVADLLCLRRHLAAAVLEVLAQRPPTEQERAAIAARVQALAALVAQRAGGAAVDDNALAGADVAVLAAVVAATRRPLLRLALNPVVAVFAALPNLRAAVVDDLDASIAAYGALLQWLQEPTQDGIDALRALLAARDAATLKRLRVPTASARTIAARRSKKKATKKKATKKKATKKKATKKNASKKNASKKNATKKNATKKNATKKNATKKNATKKNATKKNAMKKNATTQPRRRGASR
jgi:DNA-binding FadR family transcriptional regulator